MTDHDLMSKQELQVSTIPSVEATGDANICNTFTNKKVRYVSNSSVVVLGIRHKCSTSTGTVVSNSMAFLAFVRVVDDEPIVLQFVRACVPPHAMYTEGVCFRVFTGLGGPARLHSMHGEM